MIDDITLNTAGTLGDTEIDFSNGVSIYSSHLEQSIEIEFHLMKNSNIDLMITDMLGKVIAEKKMLNIKDQKVAFSTSQLATGVYNVKINNGKTSILKKVTVNK